MVMMILTGIMGMESMAIFSLGTFLSISLRLVIPEVMVMMMTMIGLRLFNEVNLTLSGRERKSHRHQQSHHDWDQWVPGSILYTLMYFKTMIDWMIDVKDIDWPDHLPKHLISVKKAKFRLCFNGFAWKFIAYDDDVSKKYRRGNNWTLSVFDSLIPSGPTVLAPAEFFSRLNIAEENKL